jgi:predicted CopG family antitoxin
MKDMRKATSLTIGEDVIAEIANTKNDRSLSDRVNELLKRALLLERRERLEKEAAEFFAGERARNSKEVAAERRAYQNATKRSLARD